MAAAGSPHSSGCPPFSLDHSKFDLGTYFGRLQHFISLTDPRKLFYSDAQINQFRTYLDEFRATGKKQGTDADMWKYREVVESAVHPVTGEIIFPAARVCAIAPVNIPIVFAMIACPASNVAGTMFLHWLNQSYNTACNYANRSGKSVDYDALAKAYVLAVSSACTFAYGLGKFVERGPKVLKRFGVLIPCIATAAANISNVGFTRSDEVMNGAAVKDEDGNVVGSSKAAGIRCVAQTAATRCVLVPCSCLLVPPVIMSALRAVNLLPTARPAVMALEIGAIYLCLQGALPAALAVFPQTAKIDVSDLEPSFQDLRDVRGNHIKYLYANKGL